ncbi:MAG: 4Fe-4S binding protein [Candidatus Nealsonbacteria bacterium]|nr:4Fe-4S binding protein [Candidatus Nealsonbacteria bacterium]
MIRLLRTMLPLMLLLIAADVATAQTVIPIPRFITDYEILDVQLTQARDGRWEYLDLAAVFVGLVLASYFALVRRSRRGLFLLSIASIAWLGFWREGCVCPIGAIQNVALVMSDSSYAIPTVVVAMFVLPLVFTLFFGRTFCAAVCPLGAVQEVVAVRPVKVPAWLDQTLGLLAYVYLGLAVVMATTGESFLICRYDPFVALFRLGGSFNMLVFGGCFLVVGVFVGRPYCRYLCPYGAILGLLSKVSKWHVKIPPEECIQCRLCEDACPYGAIREPTVDQTATRRRHGRRRLAALIVLLPVLVGVGVGVGGLLKVPLSRFDFTVRLAERMRFEGRMEEEVQRRVQSTGLSGSKIWGEVLDEYGQEERTTDASADFRVSGQPIEELYRHAYDRTMHYGTLGRWLGGWVGLVIGVKLIYLAVRRRRRDYQPDRTGCVACGRCFWYCPGEHARQGWIAGPIAGQGDSRL